MSINHHKLANYCHIKINVENGLVTIRAALRLIKDLARFEKAEDSVHSTEELLWQNLLGVTKPSVSSEAAKEIERSRSYADCIMIYDGGLAGTAVGVAVYFYTFSTWTGQGGIYLEDLYIAPEHRSKGLAKSLFVALAKIAATEDLARVDWSVLDWNVQAKSVYNAMGAITKSEWEGMRLEGKALAALLD